MNITILSLVSSSLINNSPALVNNNFTFINSHLKHFTSTIFYNQYSLLVQKSSFLNGLGGIIFNEHDNQYNNEPIKDKSFTEPFIPNRDIKRSISVMDCQFINIRAEYTIFIDTEAISLYLTSSIIKSCFSTGTGVISLRRARCFTITHVCTFESGSGSDAGVLNYDCMDQDFSYCLYNTFAKSQTTNNANAFNIFARSGLQYYRCNNLTDTTSGGFHFSAPVCFSFAMTTALNCHESCFQISGYNSDNCKTISDKQIEMVNFFNDGEYLLKLSAECPYRLKIINSVLLSNHKNPIFLYRNLEIKFELKIEVCNCYILSQYTDIENILSFNNCTTVSYNTIHLTKYLHFTYGDICVGPEAENNKLPAKGCNEGNCIDENCGIKPSFPSGVVPYTTLIHLDMQTATFTPSSKFSKSDAFSESNDFSESKKFTQSDNFVETEKFTESKKFTESNKFLETEKFTQSDQFSSSASLEKTIPKEEDLSTFVQMTASQIFSESFEFSPSSANLGLNGGGNQGENNKGPNKAMIGAVAGVATVAAVAIVGAAVFFIRKRKRIVLTSDFDMLETQDSGITTENALRSVMNEDDPFAVDFKGDGPANSGVVI